MPFAALDDEFFGHPKTATAGLDGCGLYARSLSYCAHYLTDGFVPKAWAAEIAKPAVRRKVTASGLWIEVAGGEIYEYVKDGAAYTVAIPGPGFFIPDYIAFNPTRAAVIAVREDISRKRSEAGKKGAMVRWKRHSKPHSKPDGKADICHAETMANDWQTDGPLPLPLSTSKAVPVARPDERPTVKETIDRSLKEAS